MSNGGGGGGTTGQVSYPGFISYSTQYLLGIDEDGDPISLPGGLDHGVIYDVYQAQQENPYPNADDLDTEGEVQNIQSYRDDFITSVGALYWTTDWETAVETASGKMTDFFDASSEAAAVSDHSDRLDTELQKRIAAFAGGMADINAVNSSSFIMGMALLNHEAARETSRFSTSIGLQRDSQRAQVMVEAVRQLTGNLYKNVALTGDILKTGSETSKLMTQLLLLQLDRELDLDKRDALWNLETYRFAANMLAAPAGAVTASETDEMSTSARLLSGALGGASMGAAAGPWGMVAGGVGGALASVL